MMEKNDWPGREFSRWRRRGKIPKRGSTPIQPLRKWSKHRTDLETTKIEVSWFFHFITSAETDDKLSHTLRSTLKVGFGQARACHLVLNPLHLKKLNFGRNQIFSPWPNWLHWNCQTQSAVYRVSIPALHSSQAVQRENGLRALSSLHANWLPS